MEKLRAVRRERYRQELASQASSLRIATQFIDQRAYATPDRINWSNRCRVPSAGHRATPELQGTHYPQTAFVQLASFRLPEVATEPAAPQGPIPPRAVQASSGCARSSVDAG